MLRYLLLCVLIAPEVFSKAECEYRWFQCTSNTRPINCDAKVNEGWIRLSKLCDGIWDCDDGSDESIMACKLHPSLQLDYNLYCASGAAFANNQRCDGSRDCWDGSDELGCNDLTDDDPPQNTCRDLEMECQPGECISVELLCNHQVDCSNGRDESLLQCFEECQVNHFQCGYGACIKNDLLCDNKPDCLDGADELWNVCEDIKGYKPTPYRNCSEPWGNLTPKFDRDTKFHVARGQKYVWPNEPVHFTCRWAKLIGSEWNVCQLDGTWHKPLPKCVFNKRN
ncbi:very low-density lipoprotein receptor-like [Drosophila novamexicana]|uniref:very low-density lipoprotein receptor-like n=1 Tax=Drosophila novamexicana TaxID=47314 RepID=UPI0011E59E5A|nr:very low-density lipoprotein receptor-like [Drosophila novamexicana]